MELQPSSFGSPIGATTSESKFSEAGMDFISRPRFYALTSGQLMGFLMVIAGMFCYWARFDKNIKVPPTINWRFAGIGTYFLLTALIPQLINNALPAFASLVSKGTSKTSDEQILADNPKIVRGLLWGYSFFNLIVLTYTVHITGGITGSMYAGLFLILPTVPLFLRQDNTDIRILLWFVPLCFAGIFAAFLMSHKGWVEFDASEPSYKHAYDISVFLINALAFLIPMIQVLILRLLEEKAERDQADQSVS